MITTPLLFGKSKYEWNALLGLVGQAVSAAGSFILLHADKVSPKMVTLAVILLSVFAGVSTMMVAQGKPVIPEKAPDA